MDSDNDSYHFPKCQTHTYTRFENGCSENSTQKLLTKYSTEENNKHVISRPRSVRIGKNIREFKITITATATSLNKRSNELNNGCARAL